MPVPEPLPELSGTLERHAPEVDLGLARDPRAKLYTSNLVKALNDEKRHIYWGSRHRWQVWRGSELSASFDRRNSFRFRWRARLSAWLRTRAGWSTYFVRDRDA